MALLGWDFVIRFRGGILVENAGGEVRTANEWVLPGGRALLIRGAKVTADKASVSGVVLVHARNMKEPWCLATSLSSKTASEIVKLYNRRFTIEETFRDTKDIRFGLGLSATHIGRTDRRDRLLFLFAIAHALLTLLGAASEASALADTEGQHRHASNPFSLLAGQLLVSPIGIHARRLVPTSHHRVRQDRSRARSLRPSP